MQTCATSKKLLHEWAVRVLKADKNDWQKVFFEDRKYDKHVRKCKVCKAHFAEKALKQKPLDTKRV